ncbi:hypothetical protein EUTSA_v10022059mg [Eutrema salsugineum]|uniref:Uncharacterized protein n=1 Tax=Eutrema salsugineum TaxID=72664 RepID=V4LYH8_EUTSA|nr:hypothetical protein EUTSA_v10022059mg [Eutrema salsugineum]
MHELPPRYYTNASKLKQVEQHLNICTYARIRDDWNTVLGEANLANLYGAGAGWSCPQLAMCKVEALLKLQQVYAAQTALANIPNVEPFLASFSQTRFFNMTCGAYIFFVKSQMDLALGRYDDAAEAAEKALELDPHSIEIKIFKKNFELIQSALSYSKTEKWAEAVRDYEILSQVLPNNKAIAKSLSQAQVALKLSRRKVVLNMESGGDVGNF